MKKDERSSRSLTKATTDEAVKELMTTKPFGRPVKFKDPAEFADLVDSYFDQIARNDIATMSGLAVFLDSDRKTLINYAKKDDFFHTIQRARARCEAAIETRGLLGGLNPALSIFSLKNNYGWVERVEQDTRIQVVTPILGAATRDSINVEQE